MDNQVEQFCKRCGSSFQCNKAAVEYCDCSLVKLSEDTLSFLEKTNYKCICNSCLQHYEDLASNAKGLHFPSKAGDLSEGIHYYIENNNWVFTELYHFLRGYCCRNGCRHCVYGFNKQEI